MIEALVRRITEAVRRAYVQAGYSVPEIHACCEKCCRKQRDLTPSTVFLPAGDEVACCMCGGELDTHKFVFLDLSDRRLRCRGQHGGRW